MHFGSRITRVGHAAWEQSAVMVRQPHDGLRRIAQNRLRREPHVDVACVTGPCPAERVAGIEDVGVDAIEAQLNSTLSDPLICSRFGRDLN